MVDNQLLLDMGKRIVDRRKQLRMTQEELAEKVNVTPQMISTAELGKKAIRPENLLKICTTLEISADYLLTGKIADSDISLIDKKISLLNGKQLHLIENIINDCVQLCGCCETEE
jgi:transcriptional regulator with XRE-family HTH domain